MVIIRWVIGLLLLLVFSLFAFVVWLALNEDVVSEGGEPPLIKAEGLPFKEIPSDRGGAAVLNESSPLVQSLDRGADEPIIERILPAPDDPPRSAAEVLPAQQPEAQDSEESQQLAQNETSAVAGIEAPEKAPSEPEPIEPAAVEALESSEPDASVTPIEPIIAGIETPQVAAVTPQAIEPPAAPSPQAPAPAPPVNPAPAAELPKVIGGSAGETGGSSGVVIIEQGNGTASAPAPPSALPVPGRSAPATDSFRVQLSALRQPGQAEQAWREFQAQYPDILGDGEVFVVETETDRGTFFRVQAGLYGSREDAGAACNAIKSRGGDCFVVRGGN